GASTIAVRTGGLRIEISLSFDDRLHLPYPEVCRFILRAAPLAHLRPSRGWTRLEKHPRRRARVPGFRAIHGDCQPGDRPVGGARMTAAPRELAMPRTVADVTTPR